MADINATPVAPAGTLPLPGDTVRQIVRAPIMGTVSKDVPLQVNQKTGNVQFLLEWPETDAEGIVHTASTWFEAADVEILERAPQVD